MGGIGSGRFGFGHSATVETYHKIDLAYLKRMKLLQVGNAGTLSWSRGGELTGWIRYSVEPGGLRLNYRARSWGEREWTPVLDLIPFVLTATQFGGFRRWFRCPSCGRRCRIVYGGGVFRCRKCHGLTYETQYEEAATRAITRAQRMRKRLGGSGNMEEPFPARPKGMHRRTYHRLEAEDDYYQQLWAVQIVSWLKRLKG